jgi:stearoyl-CoA desaturase (Delta-9 desaturase)
MRVGRRRKARLFERFTRMTDVNANLRRPTRKSIAPRVLDDPVSAPLMQRIMTGIAIVVPFLAVAASPFLVWGWGFHWTDLSLLVVLYVLTAVGITVGFHRLFTHRSFETNVVVQFILAALGSMALQGSLFKWVALHRLHHQYSDSADDPHSPHHFGRAGLGFVRGFWHAHIGWFFEPDPPDLAGYVKDLSRSRSLRVADALFLAWAALGLAVPAVLGGLLTHTWAGVWTGLIWGGLVRLFLVHHVTWSVNSACHLWGSQPFGSHDRSRNNFVFGVLAMGEGWHNSHHAFPSSARHGLQWWQVDVSYWIIRALALVGLTWNVKVPTKQAQRSRLTTS